MTVRRIGNATIEKVEELCAAGFRPNRMFPKFDQAAFDAQKHWMVPVHVEAGSDRLVGSVHTWVVKTGRHTILIDTCLGNHKQRHNAAWNNLDTPFLNRLRACVCPPESVDFVMCTHLHVDHVGWNTMLVDGRWIPTFPNARYLLAQKEWNYWDANEAESGYGPVISDSVRPIIEAGLVDLIAEDAVICPEVRLEPTPGHTPGHVSVHITSAGQEALITGDCIHHPCQMSRLDWCSSADFDQGQGEQTRNDLLARYVDSKVLVIGTHFATPTAGHVKHRAEGGYWLDVGS